MTHARGTRLFYGQMDTVLGLILFVVYLGAVLVASAAITMLVIKLSPSEAAREQRAARKAQKT
jgi:NADH:ubiquinone oxidoreductase subunit 6 (subunit J)